jgi:hypothetical protein
MEMRSPHFCTGMDDWSGAFAGISCRTSRMLVPFVSPIVISPSEPPAAPGGVVNVLQTNVGALKQRLIDDCALSEEAAQWAVEIWTLALGSCTVNLAGRRSNVPPRHEERPEHFAEADRLRLLDAQTQRDFISMYRVLARTKHLSRQERQAARERADALARLLRIGRLPAILERRAPRQQQGYPAPRKRLALPPAHRVGHRKPAESNSLGVGVGRCTKG